MGFESTGNSYWVDGNRINGYQEKGCRESFRISIRQIAPFILLGLLTILLTHRASAQVRPNSFSSTRLGKLKVMADTSLLRNERCAPFLSFVSQESETFGLAVFQGNASILEGYGKETTNRSLLPQRGLSTLLDLLTSKNLPPKNENLTLNQKENIKELLGKMGISDWMVQGAVEAHKPVSSEIHLSTLSMAQLGQLVLQSGRWIPAPGSSTEGLLEIAPDSRIRALTSAAPLLDESSLPPRISPESPTVHAGPLHFFKWRSVWIDDHVSNLNAGPDDVLFAQGEFGQYLMILPSAQLVIARNGGDPLGFENASHFVETAIECFAPNREVHWQLLSKEISDPVPLLSERYGRLSFGTMTEPGSSDSELVDAETQAATVAATEICNCLFVSQYDEDDCAQNSIRTFPSANIFESIKGRIIVDRARKAVGIRVHGATGPQKVSRLELVPETLPTNQSTHQSCREFPGETVVSDSQKHVAPTPLPVKPTNGKKPAPRSKVRSAATSTPSRSSKGPGHK